MDNTEINVVHKALRDVNGLIAVHTGLESLVTVIADTVKTDTVNDKTATYMGLALDAHLSRVGLESKQVLPALDNLETLNDGIALEGILKTLSKIWEAIKKALLKVYKSIKNFFSGTDKKVDTAIAMNDEVGDKIKARIEYKSTVEQGDVEDFKIIPDKVAARQKAGKLDKYKLIAIGDKFRIETGMDNLANLSTIIEHLTEYATLKSKPVEPILDLLENHKNVPVTMDKLKQLEEPATSVIQTLLATRPLPGNKEFVLRDMGHGIVNLGIVPVSKVKKFNPKGMFADVTEEKILELKAENNKVLRLYRELDRLVARTMAAEQDLLENVGDMFKSDNVDIDKYVVQYLMNKVRNSPMIQLVFVVEYIIKTLTVQSLFVKDCWDLSSPD